MSLPFWVHLWLQLCRRCKCRSPGLAAHGQCAVELTKISDARHQYHLTNYCSQMHKQLSYMDEPSQLQEWSEGTYIWLDTCGKNGVLTSAIKVHVKWTENLCGTSTVWRS
ncbi:hypothetical protein VPH35_034819 [Triticum aestivum]|uniref:Uncharacterized protein n=1 Tax=Aegilops tauschii subsp. strangulata TaxID=200361 RepID=A0A453AM05_AEGTS